MPAALPFAPPYTAYNTSYYSAPGYWPNYAYGYYPYQANWNSNYYNSQPYTNYYPLAPASYPWYWYQPNSYPQPGPR
jgi:hypothetical protein